jgi:hypothetical protein
VTCRGVDVHRASTSFAGPDARASAAGGPTTIRPGVRLLLDAIPTPAFVIGRRLDILATNRMARAMLADFDAKPVRDRNHARWIFLDPVTRDLYVDWPVVARENVAILRRDAGRYPHDAELQTLVGELSVASPEFRTWWADHDVLARPAITPASARSETTFTFCSATATRTGERRSAASLARPRPC